MATASDTATKSMRQIAQVVVIKCELCDHNKIATWNCTVCNEVMCNQCKTVHLRSKATRNHSVVAIDVETEDDCTKVETVYCEIHKTEPLQMHCIECDIGLCLDCITGNSNHKSHGLLKVQEVIDNMRTELKGIISESNDRITSCTNSIQQLQKHHTKYSEDAQVCIDRIKIRGIELKAEIDKIIQDSIQEVQTAQTNDLDLLHEKLIQKNEEKKELEEFATQCADVLRKKSSYALVDVMKEFRKKLKQIQTSSTAVSAELMDPPYFTPGPTDKMKLKEIFGIMKGIDTTMVTSFKPSFTFTGIATVNENQAWVGYRGNDKNVYLITKNGDIVRKICHGTVEVFTVSKGGHLLITFSGIEAIFQEINDGLKIIINTSPFIPKGICSTHNDDILVSLTEHCGSKIVRYSLKGDIKQTVQYGQDKSPLFKYPKFIEENINKDICVIDDSNCLKVVDKNGHFQFQYLKPPGVKLDKYLLYQDVACDNLGHILISDEFNHVIHLLSTNGKFLKFILNEDNGLEGPWGLSFDNKGHLWMKDGNAVKIFKYHA